MTVVGEDNLTFFVYLGNSVVTEGVEVFYLVFFFLNMLIYKPMVSLH